VALRFILIIFMLLAAVFFRSCEEIKTVATSEFKVPLGLPPIPWPEDNPYTTQKAELGRLLYFDKRLSSDGTISCATCHQVRRAFTDNKVVSEGILGRLGTRHAPTVINSAYQKLYFWDGRAATLEEQCKGPIANPKEMTLVNDVHEAHCQCQERIKKIKGYKVLFRQVFGHDECTIEDIAKAISTFERTVLSGNSPFDRYQAGDKTALTEDQIKGYQIFIKAGCPFCHSGPNFSDDSFANIGIGMNVPDPDLGRYDVTKQKKDWGAFKVPTLREVSKTYPYMHNGVLQELEDVVEYYNRGGLKNPNLHPRMQPLRLTEEDKKALLSFLESLSGEGWQHFKAPETFPE
jgi:cytochrome c peroxidase